MKNIGTAERKVGLITGLVFEDGFGFAATPDGIEYFFHASDVVAKPNDPDDRDRFEELNTGDTISFVPYWNLRKKKWRALGVQPVEKN